MKKLLSNLSIAILLSGVFSLIGASPVSAAANLYLSPATQTVTQGDTFSVQLRANIGGTDTVNAVQAKLSYPTDKLECSGVSNSGGAFSISQIHNALTSSGGGAITIVEGTTGSGVSGDKLVATINFKAKVGSGSAQVSFVSGSIVVRGTDYANIVGSTTGGTYTFTTTCKTADLNCDGAVNIRDFGIFLGKWGTSDAAADFNHDGTVNIRDFGIFLGKWGT